MTNGSEHEFRELFRQEAEQRLTRLSEQLLQLETVGNDPELVASIFRDAHTLKGGAGVVGLDTVAAVAHAMEDLLEGVRSGERLPTPELIDAVLVGVDGLREMITAVLAGEDRAELAATLETGLRAAAEPPEPPVSKLGPRYHESVAEQTEDAEPVAEPSFVTPAAASTGTMAASAGEPAAPAPATATQVLTRPERRTEHEVVRVPVGRLDELVRLVGESAAAHLRVGSFLAERLGTEPTGLSEFRELSLVLNELQEKTMRARMVPVATITDSLHRAARDLARSLGKSVKFEVRGEDTELDRTVLDQISDALLHLVRNAVDHGIETPEERAAAGKPEEATLRLHAMQLGSEVIVTVTDDGRGIDREKVRSEALRRGMSDGSVSEDELLSVIFRSGFSTASYISDVSGRGVGLDVVRSAIDAVRGRIEVHSEPGSGTEFRIIVPITLAVLQCLLVVVAGRRFAVPMHSVVVADEGAKATHAEGRPVLWMGGQAIPMADLSAVLGIAGGDERGPVVVVSGLTRTHAFRVDALIGQRDVVVKGLPRLLPRLDVLAGASVEPDGTLLLVLDAAGLIDRARLVRRGVAPVAAPAEQEQARRASILVVDDAMTVRELQRSILERAGYRVRTANDGLEGLARLAEEPADLILTDIEMPRMDGFAFTEAVRKERSLAGIPVLILTSRASDEDRRRGLDAGADGYIVKSAFDEAGLLSAVERLLGRQP